MTPTLAALTGFIAWTLFLLVAMEAIRSKMVVSREVPPNGSSRTTPTSPPSCSASPAPTASMACPSSAASCWSPPSRSMPR